MYTLSATPGISTEVVYMGGSASLSGNGEGRGPVGELSVLLGDLRVMSLQPQEPYYDMVA